MTTSCPTPSGHPPTADPALPAAVAAVLHERMLEHTIDEGDCVLWMGVYNNKSPQVFIDGRYHMVRRLLWQAERGPIPAGLHPRCTCGEPRCVNLEHVRLRTTRQIGKDAAKTGAWSAPLRRAKLAAAARARSRLTQADVDRIREADNAAAIARELGISRSTATKIRRGQSWAPMGAGLPGWFGSGRGGT